MMLVNAFNRPVPNRRCGRLNVIDRLNEYSNENQGFTKRKSKSHEQLALRRNKQCHSRQPEHIPCQRYW